jgi:acyl transferase domain-containing protein
LTGKELFLEDLTPSYFSKHLREAVQFVKCMEYVSEEFGVQIFIECGPTPTLIGLARKTLLDVNNVWISSAKKDMDIIILYKLKLYN